MLLIERRRPCSPTVVALIGLCFFMSIWHLSTFPNELDPTTTGSGNLISLTSTNIIQPVYEPVIKEQSQQIPFDVQQLPIWDYTTLINLDEFVFDLINLPCNDTEKPPLLLILVHSAPSNFQKRKTIRRTWGQPQKSIHVLFILGRVENKKIQKQINKENSKYNDIIQGSFLDSYRNMTYKHVTALKYSVYHCPEARYILKTDDDIFVNMPLMINFLSIDISPYGARKLIYCTPNVNSYVKRSYRSKWRVSPKEYPHPNYPTYCPGWAVIYSPDVAFKLYVEAQHAEYFWIDDVHITGTLVQRANFTHTTFNLTLSKSQTNSLILQSKLNNGNIKQNFNNQSLNFLFACPDLSQQYIETLWFIVQRFYSYLYHANNSLPSSTITAVT